MNLNELMKTILHRRAIRRFADRQIEEEALEQILQAGLYAPSAGGGRGRLWPFVRISRSTSGWAGSSAPMPGPAWLRPRDAGNDRLGVSAEDCAVAAENMMLAADSLGVGSCYIGQGWTAFADPYGQEILKQWGIRTGYYAVMQLLLGYPREGDAHPAPKPRKQGRVLRF